MLSDGDLTPFVLRPISAALFLHCLLTVVMNFDWFRRAPRRVFVTNR